MVTHVPCPCGYFLSPGPHYRSPFTGISTPSKLRPTQHSDWSLKNVPLTISFSWLQTPQWLLIRLQIKSSLTKSRTSWLLAISCSFSEASVTYCPCIHPQTPQASGHLNPSDPLSSLCVMTPFFNQDASERPSPTALFEVGYYSLPIAPYLFFTELTIIYNNFIIALARLFIIYNASHSCGEQFCLSDQAPACHGGLSFSLLDPQQLKGWWRTKTFVSE